MRNLILIPLLLLASCTKGEPEVVVETGGSSSSSTASSTPATPANPAAPGPGAAEANTTTEATAASNPLAGQDASKLMKDEGIASGSKPLIPANPGDQATSSPQQSGPKPKRTPQFGFEATGSITQQQLADYYVEMTVAVDGKEVGTMVIDMWAEAAPSTVRNFLRYVDEGFYDGLGFHRIARNFMVQGGDPQGTGAGDGPYGSIRAEFSTDESRKHGYGVLSMARGGGDINSASCQFFICCAESMDVWNLDGKYASFGKLVSGVDALEAMANVPVGGPRRTSPMRSVKIVKAVVKKGEPPKSDEKIERPAPDLNGEAADITVQHILISFRETPVKADRTKEDAEKLAQEILKRAKDGEDFSALVKEYSDDNLNLADDLLGAYRMVNHGAQALDFERAFFDGKDEFDKYFAELRAKVQKQELQIPEAQAQLLAYQLKNFGRQPMARGDMAKGFGDTSFSLKVGEIAIANYDPVASPFGWHIIRRVN